MTALHTYNVTSFLNLQQYAPFSVALVGLATFIGLWGLGKVVLWSCRLSPLPQPWSSVTAVLLGIQTTSLAVQIAGMIGIASRFTLTAIWICLLTVGVAPLLVGIQNRDWAPRVRATIIAAFTLTIVSCALVAKFLIALAPSTKIDELYYHMLVPSRIVVDGALHFYRMPWEAAIWPQLAYQISSAPLHSIGYPDSANVISWALSVMLVWFAWSAIRANSHSEAWSGFWVAVLCVGIYPAVWHVTGGAHAMGDLAMASAVVGFADRERILAAVSPTRYAVMISILLVSAASSKLSLLPACIVLLSLTVWYLMRSAPRRVGLHAVAAMMVVWIILYGPILIWTWIHSGSPFGPALAGLFGSSIYRDGVISESVKRLPYTTAYFTVLDYSPLVWFAVVGAIWFTNLSLVTRASLGFLFGLQLTLIYFLLPHDPRFLGGIHYGLLIVFAATLQAGLRMYSLRHGQLLQHQRCWCSRGSESSFTTRSSFSRHPLASRKMRSTNATSPYTRIS